MVAEVQLTIKTVKMGRFLFFLSPISKAGAIRNKERQMWLCYVHTHKHTSTNTTVIAVLLST